LRDIQKVIQALGSPVRREILALIWDTELPAGEIAATFAVTKPTISQHLAVLRDAELVSMTRAGTQRRYRARQESLAGMGAALEGAGKWEPADAIPERALSEATTGMAVTARVEVPTDQATTFAAFTNPVVYSRWLGVPVTIRDGRFAATMEWGTEVRGTYELVSPPDLIAIRWDFDPGNVPVPGRELTGYLRVRPRADGGSTVEVHQLVGSATEAEFMEVAWSMVLGRLKAGVAAASDPSAAMAPRPRRPKRRRPA